jgi:hypothetical protein
MLPEFRMTASRETRRFSELFAELDGDTHRQRHEVTLACIEALLDRVVNPPMLDAEYPKIDDIDGAERYLKGLISEEAERFREFIRSHRPEDTA